MPRSSQGCSSIDNAARICHSPSTVGLKKGLNVAATTCSYSDWLKSDLIVFIGSNMANNQPVATKYIHYAKKNGAKVAVINSYRQPYRFAGCPCAHHGSTRLLDRGHGLAQKDIDVGFMQPGNLGIKFGGLFH